VWVPDPDPGLEAILGARGFAPTTHREPMAMRPLTRRLPSVILPDGYRLHTLAEDDDIAEVNRVLWRGFDHEGTPPDDEIPGRIRMQRSPHFRRDLNVVVEDEAGGYVSYAGVWVDPINRVTMIEPVATDPDHRRRGLASAAIVEALRRAQAEGATVAWVGSDLPVYTTLGFVVTCHSTLWLKRR
jgi:predicted N-acetyltransferase YhbS